MWPCSLNQETCKNGETTPLLSSNACLALGMSIFGHKQYGPRPGSPRLQSPGLLFTTSGRPARCCQAFFLGHFGGPGDGTGAGEGCHKGQAGMPGGASGWACQVFTSGGGGGGGSIEPPNPGGGGGFRKRAQLTGTINQ